MSPALADELFLMSHDLRSGKAQVGDSALGLGLASALLAELVFAGSLVISQGMISLGEYSPPAEPLADSLHEDTRNRLFNHDVTVRDWLAAHRRQVAEPVADRMIRAGDLRREQVRRMGRTSTRYLPLKPSEAFIRTQRLPSYLRNQVEMDESDAVLAGLVSMTSGGSDPLELDAAGAQYLNQLLRLVSPQLRELLDITEAAGSTGTRGSRS